MKDLLETIDILLIVFFVAALLFLFSGTPDLWDVLHAKAMGYFSCGKVE